MLSFSKIITKSLVINGSARTILLLAETQIAPFSETPISPSIIAKSIFSRLWGSVSSETQIVPNEDFLVVETIFFYLHKVF